VSGWSSRFINAGTTALLSRFCVQQQQNDNEVTLSANYEQPHYTIRHKHTDLLTAGRCGMYFMKRSRNSDFCAKSLQSIESRLRRQEMRGSLKQLICNTACTTCYLLRGKTASRKIKGTQSKVEEPCKSVARNIVNKETSSSAGHNAPSPRAALCQGQQALPNGVSLWTFARCRHSTCEQINDDDSGLFELS